MTEKPMPFSDANLRRQGFKLVARYPYTRADGSVSYEKIRYEKPDPDEPKGREKTFRFRHPDGNGGWYSGIGDNTERVLYRAQNIITASRDEDIYITEGEKACELLAAHNLLATCVATNWTDVDLEPLRGRNCHVLIDANAAGKEKARTAAEALHGFAKAIRMVYSNGPADGSNIADAIGNGFTVEDFVEACAEAPLYQAEKDHVDVSDEVSLVWDRMSDIEPEPVEWIWKNRLARGKITMVAGNPGLGKSQIGIDIAARISNGGEFSDGQRAPIGSILILTAEDAAADTVRPRCEGASADLDRVHRLKAVVFKGGHTTTFSLQHDLVALGKKVKELGDVALVIIDPITSYMGGGREMDSHRNTDVRSTLEPLAAWAEQHNVAVLCITHPPKNAPAKAIHALVGSIAFSAAPRLVFLAIEDAEAQGRRLLLAVKNANGPKAPGLGYFIVETTISKDITTTCVTWDNRPVTVTADEALAQTSGRDTPALNEAVDFLREHLCDGPRAQPDLQKAAKAAGITWGTIRRAKDRLGVKARKLGLEGGWQWALPKHDHPRPETDERVH
jgi:putative DNA primase/helicase